MSSTTRPSRPTRSPTSSTSLRGGWLIDDRFEVFANARWLGGGAEGTSDEPEFGDGFTRNWLHFATISLGFGFAL